MRIYIYIYIYIDEYTYAPSTDLDIPMYIYTYTHTCQRAAAGFANGCISKLVAQEKHGTPARMGNDRIETGEQAFCENAKEDSATSVCIRDPNSRQISK